MSLSCDGMPVTVWTIPAYERGPFVVDSWNTSHKRSDGSYIQAHRVIGSRLGRQLHAPGGAVIMFSREYAEQVCAAANEGLLKED